MSKMWMMVMRSIRPKKRHDFCTHFGEIINISELERSINSLQVGTILNIEDAERAVIAEAKFLLSPAIVNDIMDTFPSKDVLYVPGVMTPTEILSASNAGARIVKLPTMLPRWDSTASVATCKGFNSISASRDGSSGKASSSSMPTTPRSEGEILQSCNLSSIGYTEPENAMRNFCPDSVLGEGGFGSVFKGWLDQSTLIATKIGSGMVIAVKRLTPDGFQGHKEWLILASNVDRYNVKIDGRRMFKARLNKLIS